MQVRMMAHGDVSACTGLAKEMHAESIYKDDHFDSAKVFYFGCDAVKDDNFLAVVGRVGTEVVAFAIFQRVPQLFGSDFVTIDHAIYVTKEHRGSTWTMRVLKMYTDWAQKQCARSAWLGVSTQVDAEQTGKLFERAGFEYVGPILQRRL